MKTSLFFITVFLFACNQLNAQTASNGESYVNQVFFDDFDGTEVDNDVWQVATWAEHGGQTGRDRCFVKDGYLNMQFINSSSDGFLSSAIQSRNEFLYGKWEARIKPSDVAGILNSVYTIDWNNTANNTSTSNGTKQEIDIEFLTYTFGQPNGKVHFAVHAQDRTSFNLNPDIELSFNPSSDFHTWGFEITPSYIEWFVDDNALLRYTYSEEDITIDAPYQLKLNAWSAVNWINGPPTADVTCTYLIDWIRFTPSGTTNINPIKNQNISGLNNYPNPFKETAQVSYTLTKNSEVTCNFYNTSGQIVKTVRFGNQMVGEHLKELDTSDLKPGVYLYSIEADGYKSFKKCLKVE